MSVCRCLTIATSDSGGGAGIQADLKAFAAAGCHGTSVLTALTAQNTVTVRGVHPVPADFVRAQLEAVFEDIRVDAAKTGMLHAVDVIETVADFLASHPVPLVVDPVMVSTSRVTLTGATAMQAAVSRLFPLATVVTPNLPEAQALTGLDVEDRRALTERLVEMGAPAALVTGGHGEHPIDHLFDGTTHIEIPVRWHDVPATHGAGCTHSATLAALLARGEDLITAAGVAAMTASFAVEHGLTDVGAGDGPVDVLNLTGGR